MSERLTNEVARLAERLAEFLTAAFPQADGALAQNIAFLRSNGISESSAEPATEPMDRLVAKLGFSPADLDFLLLAGMPEEHEGYSAVMRTLHPRGEPRPSVGLAAQLFGGSRPAFLQWLESSAIRRSGAIRLAGDAPYFERSIEIADALWPALHGCDAWPAALPRHDAPPALHGLAAWLESNPVAYARSALVQERPCTILITADSEETAFHRGLAVVQAAGRAAAGFPLAGHPEPELLRALKLHALARGAVPVVRLPALDGPNVPEAPAWHGYPDCAVLCARTGAISVRGARPLITLFAEGLGAEARRAMWRGALTSVSSAAPALAARYCIEPAAAAEIAADTACLESLTGRPAADEEVGEMIRARAALALTGGMKLIRPTATWDQLVLSRERKDQLRAAIARLDLQSQVLDEWGFLKNRPGSRGVRMLFSGPPGTGKTLSAEVLAAELKVVLIAGDISRLLSKWIGETEKNLAALFDAAERAQAAICFDEAEGLFGRRTEGSDAHDRYANLETAYLLTRLERFEGLCILTTNLRQNIDPAFIRRLEFVIDFEEPDFEERLRIWRGHIPDEKLLAGDVSLDALATAYPLVGGLIRNAAVAAAFLAAADGGKIARHHLIHAVRREYEKSGKPFPGVPVDMQ